MNFFKKLFGKAEKQSPKAFTQEENQLDYEQKLKGLESVLGKMHEMVGHALIPFEIGGTVDMYYFPNHIKGTGFVTMELLKPDGTGPRPNRLGTYELVAFTKHDYNALEEETAFNLIERKVCGLFTTIGLFSQQAVLNPKETCEVPSREGDNTCIIFDLYEPENKRFKVGERQHHLLLCIQIFRSEMEFARTNGSEKLFEKLKSAGHYPYSDLDREPVA